MRLQVWRVDGLGLASAIALAASAGCERADTQPLPQAAPPVEVQVVSVKRGEATRSITLPANMVAYQQATLCAKVSGYAKTIQVDKGDPVKAGELMAEIEVPELLADRAKYQAELQVATVDYQRINEAQKKAPDLVVPQTVDDAKGKRDIARANLDRTETLLGFCRITAPFAGVVTSRKVDPGAFIPAATGSSAANAALFTLMDFSKVRVQSAVPETEVPFIKAGLPVHVIVEELRSPAREGQITRFSHALDEATRTMLTEIELPNPTGELRPGMYARVRIIVETKPDALIVPTEALLAEKTRNSVFTLADNKAKRLTVRTGFNDGGRVEILEGVTLDTPVILLGKQALADGQPVNVVPAR
jgi:membrane fusion protein (multidrug efflux system)